MSYHPTVIAALALFASHLVAQPIYGITIAAPTFWYIARLTKPCAGSELVEAPEPEGVNFETRLF